MDILAVLRRVAGFAVQITIVVMALILLYAFYVDSRPASGQTAYYKPIDPIDLMLDQAKMRGQKVEVRGTGHMFVGVLILTKSGTASDSLYVSITKTPRADQHSLLERCGSAFCNVIVRGTVGSVLMSGSQFLGVQADTITVE